MIELYLSYCVVDSENIEENIYLHNKIAEVKFVNGYLDTIKVEFTEDDTFGDVYLSLTFTFTDINNTIVTL